MGDACEGSRRITGGILSGGRRTERAQRSSDASPLFSSTSNHRLAVYVSRGSTRCFIGPFRRAAKLKRAARSGRHHILTHCYWREAGPEFKNVNIMAVAHGTDKQLLLDHKAAIDRHLAVVRHPSFLHECLLGRPQRDQAVGDFAAGLSRMAGAAVLTLHRLGREAFAISPIQVSQHRGR